MEDIFRSDAVLGFKHRIVQTLEEEREFEALSIDGTLKLCMTVQGQASYRATKEVRNFACLEDDSALRRILTIRGRTSPVLAMEPVAGANLLRLSLDPVHLAIVYEYGQWNKRTPGSKILR